MSTIRLHQMNSPSEPEYIDSTDISTVDGFNGHSAVNLHSGTTKYVTETPEEIYDLIFNN